MFYPDIFWGDCHTSPHLDENHEIDVVNPSISIIRDRCDRQDKLVMEIIVLVTNLVCFVYIEVLYHIMQLYTIHE